MKRRLLGITTLGLILLAAQATAQVQTDNIQIHGFAG